MAKLGTRLQRAWNAFFNKDPTRYRDYGIGSGYNPSRPRLTRGSEKSIVNSLYNRIALDVAAISIKHVRLDEQGRISEEMKSGLNECISLSANKDQVGRAFLQDLVISMFDEGCVAVVPIDTDVDPENSSYEILSLRVGKIREWYPDHVRIEAYNDRTGQFEEMVRTKASVAIIENPLYLVMNEHNSILQRIIRKLSLLDIVDEQSGSGKLDLIIQLPYVAKNKVRQQQAAERRQEIENQLRDSKYGIAYIDGAERITQINRAVENNLLAQIEYLMPMLYSQLGLSQAVFDGTADEATLLNYYNRTLEPILSTIVDELKRKFLTSTARTQRQTIMFFRDPFKLIPAQQIAEIADVFERNEIMTSNEFRSILGRLPSNDPKADMLLNKNNISYGPDGLPVQNGTENETEEAELSPEEQMAQLEANDQALDDFYREVNGTDPEPEPDEDEEKPGISVSDEISDALSDLFGEEEDEDDKSLNDIEKQIDELEKESGDDEEDVSEIEALLKELEELTGGEDNEDAASTLDELEKMIEELEKEARG